MIEAGVAISLFQVVINYEIAEFIPSAKSRLLRLRLAMTSEGPARKDGLKDFFNNQLNFYLLNPFILILVF